ncbi:octopamine receptor beta-2R-like [Watersipora subatra]|uniref:octopamine receptor beta-2R-like n=1 Tax=Watersipora subatra TaxID=2589382 RepID=UPI00355B44A3
MGDLFYSIWRLNQTAPEYSYDSQTSNDTLYNKTNGDALVGANHAGHILAGIVMSIIILATILGNLIVISAFIKFKSLKTMNNCFIVSLAVADLLVGVLVQPFNMYNQMVQGEWLFGHIVCNIYNSNDVFFSTASLLHLCCISCDRYIAILHPFVYERTITKFRVLLMIAGSWILSGLLSFAPIFADWYATSDQIAKLKTNDKCTFEVSQTYAFISSSISFWIPCTVMVVLYQRILSTALRQERQIRALRKPPLPGPSSEDDSELPMLNGLKENAGEVLVTPGWSEDGQTSSEEADYNDNLNSQLPNEDAGNKNDRSPYIIKKDVKQMRKLRKEHRAAKTLGIIMGCFIACMGPLFLWYTITFGFCNGTCSIEAGDKSEWVITVVFWTGYFNSCMNPIIYAFFNREFQVAYKRLFRVCLKKTNQQSWRKTSMSSEMGASPPTSRKKAIPMKTFSQPAQTNSNALIK